jgi:hypothetical protein
VAPLAMGAAVKSEFTFTRAEIEAGPCDLFRWHMWLREWGLIGFFVADTARRERLLWEQP